MRLIRIVLFVGIIFIGAMMVYQNECMFAGHDAMILAIAAGRLEVEQLTKFGRIDDLEPMLRSDTRCPPCARYLNEYRVLNRQVAGGYEVVIEPRRWRFCRPTYVLVENGKRLKKAGE
jgi:hypothetical protein